MCVLLVCLFVCFFVGKFFASGSADKHVIVWTEKFEGQLKYAYVSFLHIYYSVHRQLIDSWPTHDVIYQKV